jgi:hypothetical protein
MEILLVGIVVGRLESDGDHDGFNETVGMLEIVGDNDGCSEMVGINDLDGLNDGIDEGIEVGFIEIVTVGMWLGAIVTDGSIVG